ERNRATRLGELIVRGRVGFDGEGIIRPNQLMSYFGGQQQRLRSEAPRYVATFIGEVRKPEIMASLRPVPDEVSRRPGLRLKVSEVMANDPRGVVITVSESIPDAEDDAWASLFWRRTPVPTKEFYFLVNPAAHRAVMGRAVKAGDSLSAGGITHHRWELIFPMSQERFKQETATAMLVKVVASESVPFAATIEVPRLEIKPSADAEVVSEPSPL
ncbi:MAG: hypothetical protein JWM32_822, partial [Verrucomicrobia bacterium]|nr:hypothetical protein [Verrucomicrobiota bacterium]